MPVKLRIIQTYDVSQEDLFWELEKGFADLEKKHKEFPGGR